MYLTKVIVNENLVESCGLIFAVNMYKWTEICDLSSLKSFVYMEIHFATFFGNKWCHVSLPLSHMSGLLLLPLFFWLKL